MPPLLLVLVLLLAGCVPGWAATGGVPTADAPFTLVALDVGQPTFRFRGLPHSSGCHPAPSSPSGQRRQTDARGCRAEGAWPAACRSPWSDELAVRTGCGDQPRIEGREGKAERLGDCDVPRVVGPDGGSEFPDA
jgi:hypothetical protein